VYSQGIGPCIVPFSLVTGCEFPRLLRLQAVPAMGASSFLESSILRRCRLQNPRVSPRLQLSCRASRCSLQVSPNSASSGSTGDGSSSFLAFPILQRCLQPNRQVSPFPRLPASPCDEPPGFPEPSSSGCRRWFIEFPRVPHPSALPSSNLQVSPALRLKQRLSIDSPGLPGSSIFRLRRRWFLEFPRVPHPSAVLAARSSGFPRVLVPPASPADEPPGLPENCIFRLRRR